MVRDGCSLSISSVSRLLLRWAKTALQEFSRNVYRPAGEPRVELSAARQNPELLRSTHAGPSKHEQRSYKQ